MFEKLEPKRKSFHEVDNKIEKTLKKQQDISIVGDISAENYTEDLNQAVIQRKIIGREEKVVDEDSWEEERRDEQLSEKMENLRLKFVKLREEIKERQIIINELRQTKYGAEKSAKNLNWKELTSKERNSVTTEMMRTAEDRIERLSNKIQRNEIELTPMILELGQIEETMNLITGLMRQEIPDEEKTIGNQRYDFRQN